MEIKDLEPKNLWANFYALTRVPRPSGHLDAIRQFLMEFAKENNIEAFVDNAGNVIYRQSATPGMEDRPIVTLQGHMDMVPQKSPDSTHNFETDPIPAYVDGDWVKTKGTTLGADDGMALAAIMGIMTDHSLKHGPLEALMTVDEETCMYGVNNLRADTLKGRILLNLDNENEGEMIIGSAGGVNVTASMKYREVPADPSYAAIKIALSGLQGGHSGLEINQGRANANKLLVRIVRDAVANFEAHLVSWNCGNMRNAIPNNGIVVLNMPKSSCTDFEKQIKNWKKIFTEEYEGIESNIQLTSEEIALPEKQVPEEIQDNLINAIYACHDGVLRNIPSLPHIVETSSNLAIVEIDKGKVMAKILVRSSQDSMRQYNAETVSSVFAMAGLKVEWDGAYPAWQPNTHSSLVELMKKVYNNLFGTDPVAQVVHAGLECGGIGSLYPGMEMVSIGPTTRSPHTPGERTYIPDAEKYYKFIVAILENLPANK